MWLAVDTNKLGSLKKTIIASLFHFGLHSDTIFLWKKTMWYVILGNDRLCRFLTKKRPKNFMMPNWFFDHLQLFFWSNHFWSGAKQRVCFKESMSVVDQNGRIQALGFLAWLSPLQVIQPITTFLTLVHASQIFGCNQFLILPVFQL